MRIILAIIFTILSAYADIPENTTCEISQSTCSIGYQTSSANCHEKLGIAYEGQEECPVGSYEYNGYQYEIIPDSIYSIDCYANCAENGGWLMSARCLQNVVSTACLEAELDSGALCPSGYTSTTQCDGKNVCHDGAGGLECPEGWDKMEDPSVPGTYYCLRNGDIYSIDCQCPSGYTFDSLEGCMLECEDGYADGGIQSDGNRYCEPVDSSACPDGTSLATLSTGLDECVANNRFCSGTLIKNGPFWVCDGTFHCPESYPLGTQTTVYIQGPEGVIEATSGSCQNYDGDMISISLDDFVFDLPPDSPDNNTTTPDNNTTTPDSNTTNPDNNTTTPDNNTTNPDDNNTTTPDDTNTTNPDNQDPGDGSGDSGSSDDGELTDIAREILNQIEGLRGDIADGAAANQDPGDGSGDSGSSDDGSGDTPGGADENGTDIRADLSFDINGTMEELEEIKNSEINATKSTIEEAYQKDVDLLEEPDEENGCGEYTPQESVNYMNKIEVEDPLIKVDETLEPYYEWISMFLMTVAAIMGLASVFFRD